MVVSFGKHSGKHVSEVPKDYLDWGSKNLNNKFKDLFKQELERRENPEAEQEINNSFRDTRISKINEVEKDYTIVLNDYEISLAMKELKSYTYVAFDTETTGLEPRTCKVVGLSFSGKVGKAFYIPFYSYKPETDKLVPVWGEEKANEFIDELIKKQLLTWNGSFDSRMVLHNYGRDISSNIFCDGMILKHFLQEEKPFGLKPCAIMNQESLGLSVEEEANVEQIEMKESVSRNGGSTTKTNYEMYKADLDILGKYACADADLTLRLCLIYNSKLHDEGLEKFFYDEESMPLYREVTIPMEDRGIEVDLFAVSRAMDDITVDMENLEETIINQLVSHEGFESYLLRLAKSKIKISNRGAFGQKIADKYFPEMKKTDAGKYSLTNKNLKELEDGIPKEFLIGTPRSELKNVNNNIKYYKTSTESRMECIGPGELTIHEKINLLSEAIEDREALEKKIEKQNSVFHQELIELYKEKYGPINISSKKQMAEYCVDVLNINLNRSAKDNLIFDSAVIDDLAGEYQWALDLSSYNKLNKIKGTYLTNLLDKSIDGRYYPYYKQHGTVSGRYSSNAQQFPRPKEEGSMEPLPLKYTNMLRGFFVSGDNRKFVDSDYVSLEPHVFAHVSGDERLRDIFRKNLDFYSTIAIATENLVGISADPKDDNFLKKVDPAKRQSAKAYCLGIPYGMGSYALSKALEIEQDEAQDLIDGYLDGFPELKSWMKTSRSFVQKNGYMKIETGRIRHLPKAKKLHNLYGDKLLNFKFRKKLLKSFTEDEIKNMYRDYKNSLNNGMNVQIQGLSASIVNRAAIQINREFKKRNINAWVCMQVHDQIVCEVPDDRAEECRELVEHIMENVVQLSIKLKSPAELAVNLLEGH